MTPNKTLPEKVLIDGAPAEELKVSAEVLLEEDVAVALVSSALSVAVEMEKVSASVTSAETVVVVEV